MALDWNLARFKLEDLYQLAYAVERKGYEFYGKLMEASESEQVKNEMRFLRDEEETHQAFFAAELSRRGKTPGTPGPELDSLLEKEFLGPLQGQLRDEKVSSF